MRTLSTPSRPRVRRARRLPMLPRPTMRSFITLPPDGIFQAEFRLRVKRRHRAVVEGFSLAEIEAFQHFHDFAAGVAAVIGADGLGGFGLELRGQGLAQSGFDVGFRPAAADDIGAEDTPRLTAADVHGRHPEAGGLHHAGGGVARHQSGVFHGRDIPAQAQAVDEARPVGVVGGEFLHPGGADGAPGVGVGAGNEPEHAGYRFHGLAQRFGLHGGVRGTGGGLGVEGDQGKGLHQVKAGGIAQFFPAHFGHSADVFIPQAAHAEDPGGVFPHAHQAGGAVGAGREMHRRHLADAVAVVLVGSAQGHIPAGNVGDGDMQGRSGGRHGENLKPVPQHQHAAGAVGGKILIEHFHGAGDGAPHRFVGFVFPENRQPGGDVHRRGVGFDLRNRAAQAFTQMSPGHHQLQTPRGGQLAGHRAPQAVVGPGGGDEGHGVTVQSFHPPQNPAWRSGPAPRASAWG